MLKEESRSFLKKGVVRPCGNQKTLMHIGLVGGIGPAATIYYYRELVRVFAEANTKLDLTIVNADSREMVANLVATDTQAQARLFSHYTARLKASGCDFVALTSMGGHFCIADFEQLSPLPILNAIPVMNQEFLRRTLKRVGILGTSAVMNSGLYGVSSTQIIAPPPAERQRVHDTYVAMAEAGTATHDQRTYMEGCRLSPGAGLKAPKPSCSAAPIFLWLSTSRITLTRSLIARSCTRAPLRRKQWLADQARSSSSKTARAAASEGEPSGGMQTLHDFGIGRALRVRGAIVGQKHADDGSQFFRRAILLEQFGNDLAAGEEIDHGDVLYADEPAGHRSGQRIDTVGHRHRHAGQSELQRGGAGFGESCTGGGVGIVLVGKLRHDQRFLSASPRRPC